jgi:two-component system, OmpR family, sensor histidine kinase CpxA
VKRFALRIFLSAWVILSVSVALTALSLRWLPASDPTDSRGDYGRQLVAALSRDLEPYVAGDPSVVAEVVRNHASVAINGLVEMYVVDVVGQDVLGRQLPRAVARYAARENRIDDPRLDARAEGLNGYTVVAYHGRFPFGRMLFQPGTRGLLFGIALVVSAIVSLVLARFVVLPVTRLREAGRQVAQGDLGVRVAPTVGSRKDDIAELARDFDLMTERVQALLESRQRLMRDVSHELRSPLARLQALISIARQKQDGPEPVPLDRMERELERLDALIGEILSYARLEAKEDIARRPTDLIDLIQNIVDDTEVEGQEAGNTICLNGPSTLMLNADGGLLQGAIENVVRNAVRYAPPQTVIDVTIAEVPNAVAIVIRDRGPGVPDAVLEKLFQPFYRVEDGRSTDSGTGGIGLAIAHRSVCLHGGTIRASNHPGGGLHVEITLPR